MTADLVDAEGCLTPEAIAIFTPATEKAGGAGRFVNAQFGFSVYDASLGFALKGYRLRNPLMIDALRKWIEKTRKL